jgi:Glycosyl transferase family 2
MEEHSRDNIWEEIQRVQAKYGDQWDIKIARQAGKGKDDAVHQGFNIATSDVMMIWDLDLTVRQRTWCIFLRRSPLESASLPMAVG